MTANYSLYLEYLESFADSHSLAVQTETNIYPLFTNLKNLINYYKSTIGKFGRVQNDLVVVIEALAFDEKDINYFQYFFQGLITIEAHLQELRTKKVSPKVAEEINAFILEIYSNTSLYTDINKTEEQIFAKINYTYDLKRKNGCISVILLVILFIIISSFTLLNIK